jgi:hypothetical protein
MNDFGTQTNYSLDIIKPYQRPELSHSHESRASSGMMMFNLAIMVKTEGTVAVGSSDLLGHNDKLKSII